MASLSADDDHWKRLPDGDRQLQTRVAWYYFIGNLTQQQIATRLGTTRIKVNRMLAASRESGLVRIIINSPLTSCVELEQTLTARFGLRAAVVVPTPEATDYLRDAIGVGAGSYLADHIADGMTLGVGWGRTLRSIMRALRGASFQSLSVVSLQGGLAHCSGINTFEIVSDFAELFGADQHFFAAPIFANSESARDIILRQSVIRDTYRKARAADLAVLTCGDLTESLIVTYGLEHAADLDSLREAGAVGDVLGHFVDAEGRLVDHPINRRTVALSLEDLAAIARVVMVSGGEHKRVITRAALRGGFVDVLVTDEATARALTA